jgi:replicative DNA helicase
MDDRLPPSDLDAEQSLLGSLMLCRDAYPEVLGIIPREHDDWFYRGDHRQLWRTLIKMYDSDAKIDLVTVRSTLEQTGKYAEVGGVDYLVACAESVPSHHHAGQYARIVRDTALRRELISCCSQLSDLAHGPCEDVGELLDQAEARVFSVAGLRDTDESRPVDIRDELEAVFNEVAAARDGTKRGIPTGLYDLDDRTGGLQAGEVVIVAGRPGQGKTSLGLCIAANVAMEGKLPVAVFSLEMSRFELIKRLMCMVSGVDGWKIKKGMIGEPELKAIRSATNRLNRAGRIYIDDKSGLSILELKSRSRELVQKHAIAAVFVDYLQLLRAPVRKGGSRQEEVSEISRSIKELARSLYIPVVVMAQLRRTDTSGRDVQRPRMSDLRESGAIEQDADVVALLHRPEYYQGESCPDELKNMAELIIDKQRNGPTGMVKLHWHAPTTKFSNFTTEPPAPYAAPSFYEEPEPAFVPHEEKPVPVEVQGEIPF